jgi:hypothetical protein
LTIEVSAPEFIRMIASTIPGSDSF